MSKKDYIEAINEINADENLKNNIWSDDIDTF